MPEKGETPIVGTCMACKRHMGFDEWWGHQNTHKQEEYPMDDQQPDVRLLFRPDAYTLKPLGERDA